MTLLELAVQGVEGLPATGRWSFRPGLNCLTAPGNSADAVVRALLALLFPDTAMLQGTAGGRAGVTFVAADGGTYRLVGGVGTEAALSKLDVATNRFAPLEAEGGVPRLLRGLGLPERKLFEALFLFAKPPPPREAPAAKAELPKSGSGRGVESKLSALTEQVAKAKPRSLRELRQRLTDVEAEELAAREIEQLQFTLDGLQQRLFQVEDTLKEVDRLREEESGATQALSAMPEVSEEAVAQVKRLPQLTQKRDETLKRIGEERLALETEEGGGAVFSLGGDRSFIGGVCVFAAALAVALIGSSFLPDLRWLALLSIPGSGIAVLRVNQWASAMRSSEGGGRKLAMLNERETRTVRVFEAEAREARALMKSLGVEGVAELEERLAIRSTLLSRQQAAASSLATAAADEGVQTAAASRDQLKQQVSELEAKLAGFGGYRREVSEIRQELEELGEEIGRIGGTAPTDIKLSLDDRPPPDEAAALLRQAAEVFAMTPAMLLQTVKERAAQYVLALSDRRYASPAFTPDGGVSLTRAGAEPLAFAQLPEADLEPCLWALRLVLAERFVSNHRMFLLLDETVTGDDARRQLLARMLQGLARTSQVFWIGGAAAALANHSVTLA